MNALLIRFENIYRALFKTCTGLLLLFFGLAFFYAAIDVMPDNIFFGSATLCIGLLIALKGLTRVISGLINPA